MFAQTVRCHAFFLVVTSLLAGEAYGAVTTRHYGFEEGTAEESTVVIQDSAADLFIESDETGLWPGGHIWIEVDGHNRASRCPMEPSWTSSRNSHLQHRR